MYPDHYLESRKPNRLRRILILVAGLLAFAAAEAQRVEGGFYPVRLERHRVQLNLLMPGFTYEFGLMPNLTVGAGVGLGLATPPEGYSLAPSYLAFSRYYHNLEHREKAGKSVLGNSGNYLAVAFSHYFVELELAGNLDNEGRDLISLALVYGLQRTYPNGITWGAEAGLGPYFRNRISDGIGPVFNLRVGWDPFARRKAKPAFPVRGE